MILYHYSEFKLTELTPQDGPRRHDAEHNAAKNQLGVWLTDDPIHPPLIGGWKPRYRHTVEVADDDPLLSEDGSAYELLARYAIETNRSAESFNAAKSYFYAGPLAVLAVAPIESNYQTKGKS